MLKILFITSTNKQRNEGKWMKRKGERENKGDEKEQYKNITKAKNLVLPF